MYSPVVRAETLCWPASLYRIRVNFNLQPQSSTPLVVQLVDGVRRAIEDGTLRAGTKIPSIRQFAHAHSVSVFTVVEAYDRLVAQGWLVSRPHSGFFVRRRVGAAGSGPAVPMGAGVGAAAGTSFDSMWYLRKIFENRHLSMNRCTGSSNATSPCSTSIMKATLVMGLVIE